MADVEQGQGQPQAEERVQQQGSTDEAAEGSSSASPPAAREPSAWRWPREPFKLPGYVRAGFRMKTFALIAVQCLLVLSITALVDFVLTTSQQRKEVSFVLFLILEGATLVALIAVHCTKTSYPMNYATLASFTLLVGISWGLAGNLFATHLHLQLLGLLSVAMGVATATQALMLHWDLDGWRAIAGPLFAGWAAGSIAVTFLMTSLSGHFVWWSLAAVGISFGQFLFLCVDMRRSLHLCNPDDFMGVIVSMDSTLLVIVSMPLFIVAACLVHVEPEENEPVPPRGLAVQGVAEAPAQQAAAAA